MDKAIVKTQLLGKAPDYSGKVRDIFDLGDKLVFIATDRLSAYDCVLPTPIPGRGKALTQISCFWFDLTKDILPNHLISTDLSFFPQELRAAMKDYEGSTMLVKKAERIDIECIVRGYLTGSGYKDYKKTGIVSGIKLPDDLNGGDKLDQPIFTPTTKADEGHDMPIAYSEMAKILGGKYKIDDNKLSEMLRDKSIELYKFASEHALKRGIVLVDTKFEFGIIDDELVLIDEILTPDSSRFWKLSEYEAGKRLSYDKQIIRDYLKEIGFTGEGKAPELPAEIVNQTLRKYNEIITALEG